MWGNELLSTVGGLHTPGYFYSFDTVMLNFCISGRSALSNNTSLLPQRCQVPPHPGDANAGEEHQPVVGGRFLYGAAHSRHAAAASALAWKA